MEEMTTDGLTKEIERLREENKALRDALDGNTPENGLIKEFFDEFPEAEAYTEEICGAIADTEVCDFLSLAKAYAHLLFSKIVAPEALAADEDFLAKHVYPNEQVRNKIILDYLDSLSHAPHACGQRGRAPATEKKVPASIASAGEMARAFFKK